MLWVSGGRTEASRQQSAVSIQPEIIRKEVPHICPVLADVGLLDRSIANATAIQAPPPERLQFRAVDPQG
jgi:hypothetical protein